MLAAALFIVSTLALLPFFPALPARAAPGVDELLLHGGGRISGEVLKETDEHLFVDVGFTVLEVPRDAVAERVAGDSATTAPRAELRHGLFTEAEGLPVLTVEDAVEGVGGAVVVIKTASGSLGSGFIVRADGYVVTNAHVIDDAVDFTITIHHRTEDGFEKKVFEEIELVALNPWVDAALLRIDPEELGDFELTSVPLGRIDELEVGETVFAVGAPLGLERTVTTGIVSLKNRASDGKVYVQTTADITFGNSGGPLFNTRGEVVAMNTWIRTDAEGLKFSLPINYVKHFLVNRDAFAFSRDNPNAGYRYLPPPPRAREGAPD